MQTETTLSLRSAALAYAAAGWRVFPLHSVREGRCTCGRTDCSSPGKHPRTPHGVKDATTEIERVIAFWTQWPEANIGIATGVASGLVVVDIDPRNGGLESLRAFAEKLPETRSAQTGGNGLHLYYRIDTPVRSQKLAPGVDLKGEGGYVVAPPSLHQSGRRYLWLTETDPAPFPRDILRLSPQNGRPVLAPDQKQWVVDLLTSPCPEGQRNETLTRLAGYFRNLLPESVTLAILSEWNRRCCEPPLPESEVRYTVHHKYVRYTVAGEEPQRWTAAALLATRFPDPEFVVRDLLPVGLSLLAGRPKRGKSYLALQIGHAVATGRPVLGRETRPGKVLYLALEDTERRIQRRLRKMGLEATDDLIFEFSCPPLNHGGLGRIVELLEEGPVLLIIDTLARILSRLDQDAVGPITDALGPLQQAAHAHSCAILAIDHHRKPGLETADVVDDVLGSTGKTAVVDTIWGLYRKSGESIARLQITGRDIEEQELSLAFDGLACLWSPTDDPEKTQTARQRADILTLLATAGSCDVYTIAQELGVSRQRAQVVLQDLIAQGAITVSYLRNPNGRPRALYSLRKGEL